MQTKIGKKKAPRCKGINMNKARKKNIYNTDHDVKKQCYEEKFRLGSGPL